MRRVQSTAFGLPRLLTLGSGIFADSCHRPRINLTLGSRQQPIGITSRDPPSPSFMAQSPYRIIMNHDTFTITIKSSKESGH